MADRSPTLATLFDHFRSSVMRDIHVAFPAQVKSYDASKQTADVVPLIAEAFIEDDDSVTQVAPPVITGVKVGFPGAGGFRVTFPVQAGDTGMCIVSDRSLDGWLSHGGPQSPGDLRRHNLSDAVFYPGVKPNNAPWTGASTSAITIGRDGGTQVQIDASTVKLGGGSASESLIKGDTFLTALVAMLDAFALAQPTLAPAITVFKGLANISLPTYKSSVVKTG